MSKKPRGNINKIREFELEKINLVDEFDILQIVGEGWFGKILLVEHRASQTEMVLKAVPKPYVSLRDFYREFHYGLHLGIHRNIVTTYDVAFETAGFYVFTQEYAPLGDLTSNVTDTGVGEVYSKRVAKQIAAALDYMHTKDIVHRDVKLDNVLIYRSDFSRVKLCDFGESYQTGTIVERRNEWLPYSPPEVLDIKPEGTYKADPSHDVWQFAIVIFVCLTGCLPWQKAASDDPRYMRYLAWQGTMVLPIRRTPKLFKLLSSRAQRMFRHFLQPRFDRRPKNLTDLAKFVDDRWLAKTAEKEMAEYETDELCPSMYSFHSSPDEKHRLLYTLADCGIETNVDRQSKKNRIKDWIEASVITEEDEDENDDTNSASPSSSLSREPVAGHISSIRATSAKNKEIKSTLKDATQKHFDPRTGVLQQGPSEMGVAQMPVPSKSASPSISNISTYNNGNSLASSLLTLGSRPDLLNSNIQIYDSVADLQRLGELNDFDNNSYGFKQSQSSSNLLTDYAQLQPPFQNALYGNAAGSNAMLLQVPNAGNYYNAYAHPSIAPTIATTTTTATGLKSILQRSKSDSVHTALYASSPALNNPSSAQYNASMGAFNNSPLSTTRTAPNSSAFFTDPKTNLANNEISASNLMSMKGNAKPSQQKSVTFSGLSNAFQTLAQITMPSGTIKTQNAPQQQKPATAAAAVGQQRLQFDSPVKDSAYGSAAEIRQSPVRTTKSGMLVETYHPNGMTASRQMPTNIVPNKINRHSSPQPASTQQQQQRFYRGAQTSTSMKDTAYDRVTVQTKKRR